MYKDKNKMENKTNLFIYNRCRLRKTENDFPKIYFKYQMILVWTSKITTAVEIYIYFSFSFFHLFGVHITHSQFVKGIRFDVNDKTSIKLDSENFSRIQNGQKMNKNFNFCVYRCICDSKLPLLSTNTL